MLEIGLIREIEIMDLNYMGQGVGKIDNFVVFVNGGIVGDRVKIRIIQKKKNFAVGEIIDILKPSEFRIAPACNYFDQCGGCQLMHMNYKEQLKYKRQRVINEFNRWGVDFDEPMVETTIGMEDPYRYRNKTTFSVTEKNGEIQIGPFEEGSHNTVDVNSCLLQSKEGDRILKKFKVLMGKYNIKAYDKRANKGTIRNIVIRNNVKNEFMLIIVTSLEKFKNKNLLVKELVSLFPNIKTIVQNINKEKTNLVMGRKNITLYGQGFLQDNIGGLNFTISPQTFFQVNHLQTEKLYKRAIEYADISKDDICFDIYCGIGTISLLAAKKAKAVYGIEIFQQSVINARENAKNNNISNVEFFPGKAEIVLDKLYKQNIKADIILLDPPRKGCEKEVIDTLITMSPDRIVYVSCNPSTLARDIKLLESGGYKVEKAQPFDQFPLTVHVEAVTRLVRE